MVTRTPFSFELRADDVVRGDVWRPAVTGTDATIVVCHGFKGFKDWGFFPYVCERLAGGVGCETVAFNFTGSGIGEDLQTFTELDRFARNTFSRELEDLGSVLERISGGSIGGVAVAEATRFGLLGHSRGGAVAILAADRHPEVQALATWAAVASLDRYGAIAEQIEREGLAYVLNARTGQQMPLRRDILDDLRANREQLDVQAAARRLKIPHLVVHGDADESVPVADAHALARAAGRRARLEVVRGTGHTLDATHPFREPSTALERVVDLTIEHFRRHLRAR
ncbi:MAG: alpha/beta hydrolase family protein [Gemmatimonadota bacterium]